MIRPAQSSGKKAERITFDADSNDHEGQHMRLEHDQSTHPRLLRKPAIGGVSATTQIKVETKVKKREGSRFVGATHLDDAQKVQLCDALKKEKIGDEIGRQIFIGALEYEISNFAHRLEQRVAPAPETSGLSAALENTLQAIVEKARVLSSLLRELPDGAKGSLTKSLAVQDERGRGYDERYLCELGCEIDRLERACRAVAADPKPEPEPTSPDPASSGDFVAKLANAFSECFEMQPTADADGRFRASLQVLGDVTGLVIGSEPEFLKIILKAKTGK